MPSQASPFNVATPSGGVKSGRSVADCITRRSLAVQLLFVSEGCFAKILFQFVGKPEELPRYYPVSNIDCQSAAFSCQVVHCYEGL
jgi:hypothetical protein